MKLCVSKDEIIELEELPQVSGRSRHGREFGVDGGEETPRVSQLVNTAVHTHFEMPDAGRLSEGGRKAAKEADKVRPAVFRERTSGLVRMVYKEVAIQFRSNTKIATRKAIFAKFGLTVRRRSAFDRDRYVVYHPKAKLIAHDMVEVSNELMMMEEVEAVSPNFVSEFPREAPPFPSAAQWHLNHRSGDSHDPLSHVDIREAWKHTMGAPRIVVAVLDDGVDIEHPNLRDNILTRPDPDDPRDVAGRDFFIADDDHPEHFNPRPKLFRFPYHRMNGNDIHGTPCAGVVASSGRLDNVFGAAPNCSILPVKIFHADDLASESRVADAIAYASHFSDILSCSWSGPRSPLIEAALQSAASGSADFRRGGLGVPVFAATGNDSRNAVSHPAAYPTTIAVGATTDQARNATYSNSGPEVWISAPSSGGNEGITTTDVGYQNRGFNTGDHDAGGTDGFHTNNFGGTSSATPLAAGVAALMLSIHPQLTLDQVKEMLRDTADRIGTGYSGTPPHSERYGHGRVNAGAAVQAALEALPMV